MPDISLRISIFIGLIFLFSLIEILYPFRNRLHKRRTRLFGNFGLSITSAILIKVIFPVGLTYFAHIAIQNRTGLLNLMELNFIIEFILSLLILDFSIYLQHLLTHKINYLWRFHRVHHTDLDLDATSALRFHPIEIILSFLFKIAVITIFGITPESVLTFEIILSSMALFNHSNIRIPYRFERGLRYLVVTPQMHISHHSTDQKYSDSNYGFNLSIWDKIFKTYRSISHDEELSIKIGQVDFQNITKLKLIKLLFIPFKKVQK